MKTLLFTAAALSMFVMVASSANAQMGGGARMACKGDVQKFCSDVQPGGGRIINCLEDHSKDISDECYKVMEKVAARQQGKGGDQPSGGGESVGDQPADSSPAN